MHFWKRGRWFLRISKISEETHISPPKAGAHLPLAEGMKIGFL